MIVGVVLVVVAAVLAAEAERHSIPEYVVSIE
jgi:hypothetical protein